MYVNNCKASSLIFYPTAGVPQGGVLSPTLYSFFTADYPYDAPHVNMSLYADDTAYWTSHEIPEIAVHNLQNALYVFSNHCSKWRIRLNPFKTIAIVFSYFKASRNPINQLKLMNQYIKWSEKVKFLGVTILNNYSLNAHYQITIANATRKLGMLHKIFRQNL